MGILDRARERQQQQARQQQVQYIPEQGLAQAAYQESMRPVYIGQGRGLREPTRVLTPEQARAPEAEQVMREMQLQEMERQGYQESMRPVPSSAFTR